MQKIISFIKEHKIEALILTIIIIFSSVLRLWNIREYMVFLGDQGRDVMIVRDILVKGDFVFIGPTASVGGFFLGPFYYYLIAPALLLSNFDPVGPAILVAIFSIFTTFLAYYFGRKYFSPLTGLVAASLFAVSRLVVEYARSSWNPNVLPFFSLLLVLALARILENKRENSYRWFFVIGACLGIIIQLHYQAVAMHLLTFLALVIYLWKSSHHNNFVDIKRYIKEFGVLVSGAIALLGPFLLFEIYHNFPNIQNIYRFVFENRGDGFSGGRSFEFILRDTAYRLFLRLVAGGNDLVTQITIFITVAGFMLAAYMFASRFYDFIKLNKSPTSFAQDFQKYLSSSFQKKRTIGFLLLILWFICGIGVWGVYKKSIFDYYFSYMYPLPILMFAAAISMLMQFRSRRYEKNNILSVKIVGFVALFIFLASVIVINIKEVQTIGAGRQVYRTEQVALAILKAKTAGPYNFALLTPGNSDHAYRYFLEILGEPPTTLEQNVTTQLMVFCESNVPPCEPEGNSLWEVAGFGPSGIVGQSDVIGLPLYRLEHNDQYKYLEGKPVQKGNY